ncbi:homeobox and c2h2 domain-containing transcription factor protein [Stemphylium lycopersici]|uniref:Homeobox and c2h2 domain-containing transcription factor protein n=1 Tax=Stemphylium lycopersici TaxID=183478 RepID=A0A364NGY4_STELY|nr:homeobox and c2h2 domain-containing transcription factor protein [Stemphylium lycopersici]
MATPNAGFDMADFVDFGDASMPGVTQETDLNVMEPSVDETHTLGGDHSAEFRQSADAHPVSTDFNTDFSSWLPRYQKPAHPCEYCRSRSLECFIYNVDGTKQSGCSPCNALFRPCSFSNPQRVPGLKQRTALDTLDVVAENDTRHFGGLTGKKQMRSLGHVGPIEDDNEGEQGPKKGTAVSRFPRAAVKILKDWMLVHIDHPYPTDEEKETLRQQTGLSVGQISNWMANTRRRQKARPKRSASPSIRPSTEIINIPAGKTWDTMNPFERWKHSPPENEPAPLNAIAQAVETFDLPGSASQSSSYRKDVSNDSTGSFSVFKAPSISSLETGLTKMSSGSLGSRDSAYSYGSRHSLGSMNSLKAKERRRRRRLPTRAPKASPEEGKRLFQCTFCTDNFKSKYDWSRHEKSLHLSLEKWLCAPLGEIVADKATGKPKCVYCDELDPSAEHLVTHNHTACYEKGPESRTFYRKDHLRQHLRLMHGCKMTGSMETWKSEAQYIKSRCGFCGMNFDKWQDRIDHLSKEFRNGANMKDWKGCRGLDPHVAIHVTNAMPPYLIANESKSPFPFSASNSSSLKQLNLSLESKDLEYLLPNNVSNDLSIAYQDGKDPSTIGPIVLTTPNDYSTSESPDHNANATCWEILTLRLGRFAREHIEKHGAGSLTDEMLQVESRRILYGDDDPWNQTSADNPEWLNLFKKAHGIDAKAPVTGISAQHEVYEDLGINSGSAVDSSFNVNNFSCENLPENDPLRALSFECSLSGSLGHIKGHARQLSSGRQTPYSVPGLTGSPTSLASFAPVTTANQNNLMGVYEPISELICPTTGGPCLGEQGELGFSTTNAGSPKRRYWLDGENEHLAPFLSNSTEQQLQPVYQCANVGLRSSEPLNQQACTAASNPTTNDFQFPSWDQIPEYLQNMTSSAEYNASGVGASAAEENMTLPWDDTMDFAMDMDMDLNMDLPQL